MPRDKDKEQRLYAILDAMVVIAILGFILGALVLGLTMGE